MNADAPQRGGAASTAADLPEASRAEGAVTAAASPEERIGTLVDGKYRVLEKLGTGGMGVVYRVEHEKMGKHFALKMLKPQYSAEEEFYKRFVREAQAAGAIDHPHVVRVTDIGESDGTLYYVMDLFKGSELRAVLELARHISWERTRSIISQVLEAVSAAHELGIVHRDLKPDNIFLVSGRDTKSQKDHAMVFDFGIASALKTDAQGSSITQAGQVMGSPRYMSPEQCQGRTIDPRSDLYSIGVILYECLLGRPPFSQRRIMEVLKAQVADDPPRFSDVAPDRRFPDGVEEVVRKAIAKDPAERYQSARAFIEALEAVPDRKPLEPSDSRPTAAAPHQTEASRLPVFAGGFILGVLVGAAVASFV